MKKLKAVLLVLVSVVLFSCEVEDVQETGCDDVWELVTVAHGRYPHMKTSFSTTVDQITNSNTVLETEYFYDTESNSSITKTLVGEGDLFITYSNLDSEILFVSGEIRKNDTLVNIAHIEIQEEGAVALEYNYDTNTLDIN